MKILSTKDNKTDVTFEIEVESKTWKDLFTKTKRNIAKNITIQGFRKGHVPESIIDEKVTPDQVAYETLDKNQNAIVNDVIKTKEFEKSDCLDSVSKIDVVKINGSNAPILKISFDVVPEVQGIKKDDVKNFVVPPFKGRNISDEVIKQQIKMMIKNDAMISVKKDGTVAKGDIAVIDFVGYVDDKPFDGGSSKNFELEIGSKSFIDNFEDQLIGLKKGDKKTVNVKFPKDYHVKTLAGKPAKFDVTINNVKTIEYPKINKQYLKKFNIDATDEKSLEAYLKNIFKQEDELRYQESCMKIIQNEISKRVTLSHYPRGLVEMHKKQVLDNYEQEAKRSGFKSLRAYIKALGIKERAFDLILSNSAKSVLEVSLAFEKLIDEYKIEVTEADKKEQISKLTKYFGDEKKAKEAYEKNPDYSESIIIRDKLFKKLVADAKKEEPKKPEDKKADAKKEPAKKVESKKPSPKKVAKK